MSGILSRVYTGAKAVTLSDTVDDPKGPFAGLLVTATGTVSFVTQEGDTVSLTAVAANTELHIAVRRVRTTGTAGTVIGLTAAPYKPAVSS